MFYPPDRNNLSHGHCKGKYLPLYALFALHPSALIHIIESLASGLRQKQQLPLQQHSFLRSSDSKAESGVGTLCPLPQQQLQLNSF